MSPEQREHLAFALMVTSVVWLITLLITTLTGCQTFPVAPNPNIVPVGPSGQPGQIIQKAINLPWLISTSIFGIAGGLVGALFLPGPGKKIAMILSVFCAVSLGLTLAVVQYAQWLVLGTVVLCVGCGVWAILNVRKALPELVHTVEAAKEHLTSDAKELLFGKARPIAAKDGNGIVSGTIQSLSTKTLVREIRNG